jgi:hypothetical protein
VFYNIMLNISTAAPTVILDTFPPTGGTALATALPNQPLGAAVRTAYNSFLRRNTFDPRYQTYTTVSPDFHNPYSMQYSFGIQRQINASNVFEVRYVGNKGKDLFQTVNGNPLYGNLYNGFTLNIPILCPPLPTVCVPTPFNFPSFRNLLSGAPAPQACVDVGGTADLENACNGRQLAGRGLIRSRTNTGESKYDSLQMRYNGRFLNKNLNFGAAYTYSRAQDNASEIFSFGENAVAQNPFDVGAGEYGVSGFDRPHAFSMNYIYDVPFYKDQSGFVGKLLGGWQLNGTYNLASGRPYTPEQFANSQLFGGGYIDSAFANTFIGLDNLRPFVGSLTAPITSVGITNIDARLLGVLSQFAALGPLSPTGFYSLNDLNRGILTPVTRDQVRFIFNGPGAALAFGTPFGDAGRNSVRGIKLNQMNMGLFKTTNISERIRVQLRAEAFNVLNHPTSGFGVAAGNSLPVITLESAGPGGGYGDPYFLSLSSRRVQFGLRILF